MAPVQVQDAKQDEHEADGELHGGPTRAGWQVRRDDALQHARIVSVWPYAPEDADPAAFTMERSRLTMVGHGDDMVRSVAGACRGKSRWRDAGRCYFCGTGFCKSRLADAENCFVEGRDQRPVIRNQ